MDLNELARQKYDFIMNHYNKKIGVYNQEIVPGVGVVVESEFLRATSERSFEEDVWVLCKPDKDLANAVMAIANHAHTNKCKQ